VTKLPRRNFLHLAAGAVALLATSRIAWAQAYPSRPVRLIVGLAAGGGADFAARLVGQWLSDRLGQQFLIENRPGAASNVATEVVVRAPSDGYTLLLVNAPAAGSCNSLYAILRHLPGAKGIGFEVEPAVFDLTSQNIAHVNAPIELVRGSYKEIVRSRRHPADYLVVVFVAPPWGDALQPETGLHLDRTKPPILEIVHDFEQVYGAQPVLYVIEIHEVNEAKALKAVEVAFDWSDLRIYDVNVPGLQHGVLLGTRRWPS
jgi:hypothetical protein